MKTEMIPVADIKVLGRSRVEMGSIGELCSSIQKFGLLSPIIIDSNLNLHCGERRLRAFKELKLDSIPCRFLDQLTEVEKLEVELDENTRRKELTWTEELFLQEKIVRKWQEIEPTLTLENIANRLNIPDTSMKIDLFLAKSCRDNPNLQTEKEKTVALRKAREIQNISIRSLIVSASGSVKPVPTIIPTAGSTVDPTETPALSPILVNCFIKGSITIYNEECLSILQNLPTDSIDCVISDPPYGVDFDGNSDFQNWLSTFRDDHEYVFTTLLPPILTELYRVLKPDGHFYFFYAMIHHQRFLELVKSVGFKPQYVPLIWWKGAQGGLKERYRMDYEPVLFGGKDGGRRLTQAASTVQSYQNPTNKLHPAEKPVSLLEYYITQSTIEGEVVLDCFAGSGSTILACKNTNRVGIGIEKEKQWFDVGVVRLMEII